MRTILGIASVCLAASLAGPAAFGQAAARARGTAGVEAAENPYLGVGGQDITADRAKTLKLKEERGVEVTSVEADSAAAKAGLKEGDVVLEYNGQKVEGWEHLKRLVHETPIHREVKIGVWRNGAAQTFTAAVGARREFQVDLGNGPMAIPATPMPPMRPMTPMPSMPQLDIPQFRTLMNNPSLGIMGESLGPESQLAEFFGVKDGVLVREVTKGSAADNAGIKAGDVITRIDDTAISSPQQISGALRAARAKGTASVTVVRNKKEMSLSVTIEAGGGYRGGLKTPDGTNGWFVWQDGNGHTDGTVLLRLLQNSGARPSRILGQ
jgi:serine protease Do